MSSKSEKQPDVQATSPKRRTGATANEGKVAGRIGDTPASSESQPDEILQLQQTAEDKAADEASQARNAAYREAVDANAALDGKIEEADKTQWKLAAAILRVGECLLDANHRLDNAKVDAFLERQNVKRHGNNREDWRLIVKACVPPKTEADRITKLGYALTSMFGQGIGSKTAIQALENGIQDGDKKRFGLNRFVLEYKADRKAKAAENDDAAAPVNKYKAMKKDRLLGEAALLIAALKDHGIALPNLTELEQAIANAGKPAAESPKAE